MCKCVSGVLFFQISNFNYIICHYWEVNNRSLSLWEVYARMSSVVLSKYSLIYKHECLSSHVMINGFAMYLHKVTIDIHIARQKNIFICCSLFLNILYRILSYWGGMLLHHILEVITLSVRKIKKQRL